MLLTNTPMGSGRTRSLSRSFITLAVLFITGFFYVPMFGQSPVFPTETIGSTNVAATTTLANHETNNGFLNTALTMTQGGATLPADIRATSTSTGYTGASAGNNLFFTGTAGSYGFAIEGIDASAYTSLTVQFGWRKESGTTLPTLALDYWNGSAYVNIPFTFTQTATAATGWYLSPAIAIPAAGQINGLRLRWTKSGTVSCRLDDISVTGILPVPTVNVAGSVFSKFYANDGQSSEAQLIAVSGNNLTDPIVIGPTTGYEFATAVAGPYTSSLSITPVSGTVSSTFVYTRLAVNAVGTYAGTVSFSSTSAPTVNRSTNGQVYSNGVPFTSGNIVTLRVGESGGSTLTTAAAPVFVDEYTTNGVFVQSVPMPFKSSAGQRKFSINGTSTTEGFLNLSPDGQYLTFGGYDAIPGTAAISSTSAASVNRVVARVTQNGSINTSTAISDGHDAGSIRSACTVDGNAFWTGGAGTGGGNRYVTLGSAGTSVLVSNSPSNTRGSAIYNSQLFTSSQSGVNIGISTVGSGLPTSTGNTATILSGTASNVDLTNPQGFVFADIDGNGTADVLYAADGNLGIVKFSNTGGTWTKRGSLPNPAGRASAGLGLQISGTDRVLFICLGTTTTPATEIYKFVDNSAATANIASSGTDIITACGSAIITSPSATSVLFKGVSFAPVNVPTPTVTHTFSTPASSLPQGSPNSALYRIKVDVADGNALLTGVTVQTNGLYSASDFTNFRLILSTDANLDGGDPVLSTVATSTGPGQTLAFTGLGQNLPVGNTRYLFITGSVSGCANVGSTVGIDLVPLSAITYSNASTAKLGTPEASSTMTTVAGNLDDVISPGAVSGQPTVSVSWTNPSCFTQIMIVAHTAPITGTPSGSYTGNTNFPTAPTFPGGGRVVYTGTASPAVIAGLTLNQLYYFKIFVKFGANYSPGVEVTATPTLVNIYSRGSGLSHTAAIWSLSPTGTPQTLAAVGGMSTSRGLVIQNGDTVLLSSSGGAVVCRELIVQNGATFLASGTTTADNKFLYLYGDVTNNGVIGTGSTYNPVCFGLEGSTIRFKGTGTTDVGRMRKNTNTNQTTVFFDSDVQVRYTGGAGIYSNIDNSVLNTAVLVGSTLTLADEFCDFSLDGFDGAAAGNRSGSLYVVGNLYVGGILYAKNNNTSAGYGCTVTADAGSYLQIGSLIANTTGGQGTSINLSSSSRVEIFKSLAVEGGDLASNGAIVLKSTGSNTARVTNSAGTISGNIKAERHVATSGWHLMGTAIAGQTIQDWNDDMQTQGPMPGVHTYNPGSNTSSIFAYDEASSTNLLGEINGWYVPTTSGIEQGKGYRVWVEAGHILDNTGTYNMNPGPISLQNTGVTAYSGWNLVLNPHLCPVTLAGLQFGPNVQSTVVQWNPFQNRYEYTGALGSLTGVTLNNGISPIASGQAFFVKCTAPSTITIPQTAKAISGGTFLRTASDSPTALEIRIKNLNSELDPTLFQFMEDASAGYDTKYDASKMLNPNLNLYTIANGERLAINAMPFEPEQTTVQLGFSTVLSGQHRFQFDDLAILNASTQVYLKDNYAGTLTQVESFHAYAFETEAGTVNDRFELIFTNSTTYVESVKSQLTNFTVSPNPVIDEDFSVTVKDGSERVELTISDLLGREILSKKFESGEAIKVERPQVKGQYLIRVKTPSSLHTKSVIVQ
jgi:hypothetical protein